MKITHRGALVALAIICFAAIGVENASAAAPVRNTLSEVAWLQDYVDIGFLQYEVLRHQPLTDGAVNCNINSGAQAFTDIQCQQFSFLSAAYGIALSPTDPGDARDYIHHALAIITYPIPEQNASTGAYPPSSGGCGQPSTWCTASDMTYAYGDFAHTLELLNQSNFYAQDDVEDHSIVSNTIIPSLSKGLAFLSGSAAYQDMQLDWTATNRIMIHAGAYYLTGDVTSSYNASIAATGKSYGLNFVHEGVAPGQHYVEFDQPNNFNPPSNFTCVPASLCPWVPASGFWIENEDLTANSPSGYDSGYGGVGIRRADFLAAHTSGTSSDLTTLDDQLQATSTWLFRRVEGAGLITEEGNYRTCGKPNPPYYAQNCPQVSPPPVNMAWEEVAWALYNEAPFAPDVAGDTCAQYIAAARAIEYYYMPHSDYIPMTRSTLYPDVQASGYGIPSPSAAAPAGCSQTFSTIQQAKPLARSRATSFVDRRAFGGGGVTLSNGDSIAIPPADGGSGARPHTVAIVYSLQGYRPQAMLVRNNSSPPIRVVLVPTGSNGVFRQFRTVDVSNVPTLPGRRNNLSLSAERGSFGIDVSSVTLRRDLSELRER
jgi:hypothetical protein